MEVAPVEIRALGRAELLLQLCSFCYKKMGGNIMGGAVLPVGRVLEA